MKERPIIFDAESVRAILDGGKTQTRRILKGGEQYSKDIPGGLLEGIVKCPYGRVGDRLWVREAWGMAGGGRNAHIVYRADVADNPGGWYSPIYMPRVNSRITLEVTGVRVEQLKQIWGSVNDLLAEGISPAWGDGCDVLDDARDKFVLRWDSINARRGYEWQTNPWVWVVEFRRVTP